MTNRMKQHFPDDNESEDLANHVINEPPSFDYVDDYDELNEESKNTLLKVQHELLYRLNVRITKFEGDMELPEEHGNAFYDAALTEHLAYLTMELRRQGHEIAKLSAILNN